MPVQRQVAISISDGSAISDTSSQRRRSKPSVPSRKRLRKPSFARIRRNTVPATTSEVSAGRKINTRKTVLATTRPESSNTARIKGSGIKTSKVPMV